jgi:Arc/MetJ family transcription regulator
VEQEPIEIDDELLAEAQAVTGAATKKEAVRLGLETVVRLGRQAQLRQLRGQLSWEGDLDAMRQPARFSAQSHE